MSQARVTFNGEILVTWAPEVMVRHKIRHVARPYDWRRTKVDHGISVMIRFRAKVQVMFHE